MKRKILLAFDDWIGGWAKLADALVLIFPFYHPQLCYKWYIPVYGEVHMAAFRPEDNEDLIGQWWRKDGYEYRLVGIMYGADDWYWVMACAGRFNKHTQLLSCVCRIEVFGFEKVED